MPITTTGTEIRSIRFLDTACHKSYETRAFRRIAFRGQYRKAGVADPRLLCGGCPSPVTFNTPFAAKSDLAGQKRKQERDRGKPPAGKSTLHRLERTTVSLRPVDLAFEIRGLFLGRFQLHLNGQLGKSAIQTFAAAPNPICVSPTKTSKTCNDLESPTGPKFGPGR